MLTVLESHLDRSVNFVFESETSFREARYVRRTQDYFIVYLSSHDGCRKGCRFCHLTATKQVSYDPTDIAEYLEQARAVFARYDAQIPSEGTARLVHFNWMARGEPLDNPTMRANYARLRDELATLASARGIESKFKISTILPKGCEDLDLGQIFIGSNTRLYYSLYSLRPEFRRKWLPNAMDPYQALDKFADWQRATGNTLALHWAFIAGENDSEADVTAILDAVQERGLRAKFNLVRYNPPSPEHGCESAEDVIQRNFDLINRRLGTAGSRIVPRVGFDVKASCGMFVNQCEMEKSA